MQKVPHNPWALPGEMRASFVAEAGFPTFVEGAEVLFWLGCGASYDTHGQEVARAMGRILDASGVAWGVLEQETCCGEPARRLGDEALFRQLAEKLVASFEASGVKTLVTCCPHCTAVLDGDYRQLPEFESLGVEVMHHTEFIASRLADLPLARDGGQRVAYHDPCNLSRGRGVTAQPRAILEACGARVREPRERGLRTSCCGAGGGRLFVPEDGKPAPPGTPVNVQRLDQLLAAKPDAVAVACPYCPIMLQDAARRRGSDVPIVDIAEIVAGRLAPAREEGVMSEDEPLVGGVLYRYRPDGTEFPYVGPDSSRYRRHENGGGLVARTARVAPTVHVGPLSRVFGNAELSDRVRLTGRAEVGGTARATGSVVFCGHTWVTEGEFSGARIVKRERPPDASNTARLAS
jgi:hypothetical protein